MTPNQVEKINISFETIKNIINNLNKNNNYNYNDSISTGLKKDTKKQNNFFDTTNKIYNETIISYIIEHLPYNKEKQNISVANLIEIIEIITENKIGNLNIFDKLFVFTQEKLFEDFENQNNNKEILLNNLISFFKISAELGKSNINLLNLFLENYLSTNNSNTNPMKNLNNNNLLNLNNLIWLISISISNITENKLHITHNLNNKILNLEFYDKNIENELLISEKSVVNLVNLMKLISKNLEFENSFSMDVDEKVRLYKSLIHLKLEGITLNENMENYLKKFKNFHMMNLDNTLCESGLQRKFEEILKKLKVEYEKEKKTDFCAIDFFIMPNIVIEINGPDHYCFGQLKGKDNLKKRVLKFQGYKVMNVSYREFGKIQELENKIKKILKIDLKKIIFEK